MLQKLTNCYDNVFIKLDGQTYFRIWSKMKTEPILPPHFKLFYSFSLLFRSITGIISDKLATIKIFIDEIVIFEKDLYIYDAEYCSDTFNFTGSLNHQLQETNFTIAYTSDNNLEWGIRVFSIATINCAQDCLNCTGPSITECQEHQCPDGYWKNVSSGSAYCQICSKDCKACSELGCTLCWPTHDLISNECILRETSKKSIF